MKKKVLKSLLAVVCLLSSTSVSAYDFVVNSICYDVVSMSDLTCKVVNKGNPQQGWWDTTFYVGDVVIPETFEHNGVTWTVTEIGDNAFHGSINLTSVTIGNSVTKIDYNAFSNCSALTSVTLGNSVSSIGESAFFECPLTNITLPNSVTRIWHNAFRGCPLTSITLPNSVTFIGAGAFCDCTSLTSITIPDSVDMLGEQVFYGCTNLTSVTLGKSIQHIYGNAFGGCDALTTLYSLNTIPPSIDIQYNGNFTYQQYMNVNVYVPQEALAAYTSADVWKDFKNIKSIGGTGTDPVKCAKPTIRYANNKLTFECETAGVTFESKITDFDIASYNSSEIQLGLTYNISVYATKAGCVNSDVTTATLCWIDKEPQTDGIDDDISTAVAEVRTNAVLIQSANGQIDITGLDDGTKVAVYNIDGTQVGSAVSANGQACINANMTPGNIAVVKIGDRSIKVVMK